MTHGEREDETIGEPDPGSTSAPSSGGGAKAIVARVTELITPVIEAAGLVLDRIEYHDQGRKAVLQVFVDKVGGVSVDDCATLSHQVEVVLDSHDPFPGAWNLEVSSPGLTRPLHGAQDFERFAGRLAVLTMRGAVEGRSKVLGRLAGIDAQGVRVVEEETGAELVVPLERIAKARLEVEMPGAGPAGRGARGNRAGRGTRGKREVGER